MLTIHHLGLSQSERVVWLCEELGVPYELVHYRRDPKTLLAPPEFKALHPSGTAPVITDGAVVLAESGAVMEYVMARHGAGTLAPGADQPNFADYLFWLHFANGTLQPAMGRLLMLRRVSPPEGEPTLLAMQGRLDRALGLLEARLGAVPYLAGDALTAADIMTVFSLSTMRHFLPVDLTPYPAILAYLQRIGGREAYGRAMRRADPDVAPLLT